MSGAQIAAHLGLARSTAARWLRAAGLARLRDLAEPAPVRRYQYSLPGEMIHFDIKKLGRFNRIGHRITGSRKGQNNSKYNNISGWEFAHVAIDDATRLAYVEVLPDEKRWTVIGFLLRALRWFRQRGIGIKRVMIDNGACYRSHACQRTCRRFDIPYVRTKPRHAKTNGEAERFNQILVREWAHAWTYPNSEARTADLPRWPD